MRRQDKLFLEMLRHDGGSAGRVQHFTKVHAFAALIGRMEGLPPEEQETLETAALVHDIGIREAERKYGSGEGKLQEKEGPPLAEAMLESLGYPEKMVERVAWLVGHHHTYTDVQGVDYQILLEADFLVNLYENGAGSEEIQRVLERVFRTESGKRLCRQMFGLGD